VWQVLRQQWVDRGVEIVTVAEDAGGIADAKPLVDWAGATHPSLIDQDQRMARAFNVLDVASSVWIDEAGMIVRPAEPASLQPRLLGEEARDASRRDYHAPAGKVSRVGGRGFIAGEEDSPLWQEMIDEMGQLPSRSRPVGPTYTERLLDWFERGADSEFSLSPDQLLVASGERPLAHSEAAAHFELGARLWALGDEEGTVEHWRRAHRLHPDNLTYKRQAWTFASGPMQGPSTDYDGYWLAEMRARRSP
jgi:hypothetical protein